MAKNNLFLGMAAGSVGDVTLYRRDGAQISRARNRSPKNPKTTSQATQRTFFAPVARFFSPLASVLETSYEGLSRSASYSKFLSDNIKAARTNGWYVPKGAPFWPLPYTLSKGTLAPLIVTPGVGSFSFFRSSAGTLEAPEGSVGHLSRAMVAAGYKDGDQITIISVHPDGVGGYYPSWLRINLNVDSYEAASDVIRNSAVHVAVSVDGTTWAIQDNTDDESFYMVAAAVIVSRFEGEIWRRSTQSLVLTDAAIETFTGAAAIARAIASYKSSSGVPVSDIYLNGGTASSEGTRYVGSVQLTNDADGSIAAYLTGIGRSIFITSTDGTISELLTVNGVGVADGQVVTGAAVCVGVTGSGDNVVGHFVGVTVASSGVTYTPVAVTGRDVLMSIMPKIYAMADDDQYNINTRNFLLANGIPASALDFQ